MPDEILKKQLIDWRLDDAGLKPEDLKPGEPVEITGFCTVSAEEAQPWDVTVDAKGHGILIEFSRGDQEDRPQLLIEIADGRPKVMLNSSDGMDGLATVRFYEKDALSVEGPYNFDDEHIYRYIDENEDESQRNRHKEI